MRSNGRDFNSISTELGAESIRLETNGYGAGRTTQARPAFELLRRGKHHFCEIHVLLAEKRTALASMRTGSAVFASPLSVLSVLIATSHYYNFGKVMPLLVPLLLLNLGLVVLGAWLIYHSIYRIHRYDRYIREVARKYLNRGVYRVAPTLRQVTS